MKVIPHDAERDQPHPEAVDGFFENREKCQVILTLVEDDLAAIAAVDNVMHEAGRGDAA